VRGCTGKEGGKVRKKVKRESIEDPQDSLRRANDVRWKGGRYRG